MSIISSPAIRPRESLGCALFDWARTDGWVWIYIFKTVIAAMLALLVSMRLDLSQPPTAMVTVFVLMQPQSGMVFAKSFYRFCATIVGLVVMLGITALFSQQPLLFVTATALWIGICTAGAARNRNFRSYGFVLAGYTAGLIGIPIGQHPDGAFITALTRAAEVTVGIICSGAVSALIFPLYAGDQIRTTVRNRFTSFVDYISNALSGNVSRKQMEDINAAFVADVVSFEAARSVAVFEQPETRMRRGRLARLNSEFMVASTRFHALQQLVNGLRRNNEMTTLHALEPYFRELASIVDESGRSVLNESEALIPSERLDTYKISLSQRIHSVRSDLQSDPSIPIPEFDSAAELLCRFVDDLHAYTQTYASLALPTHDREQWTEGYVPKTNFIAALTNGFRATVVILLVSAFWLLSAWPSGDILVGVAAATCALASTAPRPRHMAFQMVGGTTLAAIAGFVVTFYLYPRLDGFVLLTTALAPALMFGVFLTTRKSVKGVGFGYCVFFSFLAGPANLTHYDPSAYINNVIALVCSMLMVSIAFSLVLPTDAPWMNKLLVGELRRQVASACSSGLTRLALRFESGTRDLLSQIDALAGSQEPVRREAMKWLFAVLEVGHAVIDMRQELGNLGKGVIRAPSTQWQQDIDATLQAVAHLFKSPNQTRFDTALGATEEAIKGLQKVLPLHPAPPEERHPMQRILCHLYFIRTALLDPQSPFGGYMAQAQSHSEGADHAS